jgi:tetratricopeptide (TPR) repeat protein
LIAAVLLVFLCYPATLIGRGLITAAYMKQGQELMLNGRWAEAQGNFNSAMDWSLDNESPFDSRWGVALRTGDIETAIADFTTVIRNHPSRYLGYCYRADAYREIGKITEALQDYRACLDHDPDRIWAMSASRSIDTINRTGK